MNHLEYYRYYESIDDDDHICIECESPCDGDISDDEGYPVCEECFEKGDPQPLVEQSQNPQPMETYDS